MQGKNLASLASFGKAAGTWTIDKDQAIRFKKVSENQFNLWQK